MEKILFYFRLKKLGAGQLSGSDDGKVFFLASDFFVGSRAEVQLTIRKRHQ